MRLPVAANMALATAGPTGATPGSPTPVGAAVDRAHDPIDLDVSGLIDTDLGDLRNVSLERFSNRDAAAFACRHGTAAPARLLGCEFQHGFHARLMLEKLTSEREAVLARCMRHFVDKRFD